MFSSDILGRRWGRLLAMLVLTSMAAAGCATNPVTGEQDLALISESQEIALGKQNYPKYTQKMNGVPARDLELQRYLKRIGWFMARKSHRPNLPWNFNVVNHSTVNAYALPGGKVSITRGLITKMKNEDEVASVIGHEIGHVTARHIVQQMSQAMMVQMLVVGMGAALSDSGYAEIGVLGGLLIGSMYLASYSRDQERQADELGYQYMTKLNYNPNGQVRAFKIFQSLKKNEPSAVATLFATHPLTSERVATAEDRARATNPKLSQKPFLSRPFALALSRQRERAPAYAAMDKGDKALAQKNYHAAKSHYRQAVALFSGEGLFHTRMAEAEAGSGNLRGAALAAVQGAKISPDLFRAQFSAGKFLSLRRKPRAALTFLKRAQRILPGQPNTILLMGINRELMGDRWAAAKHYNYVARTAPKTRAGQQARRRLSRLQNR